MKFFNLLKKEIRELLTVQTFLGMIVSVVMLMAMGNLMNGVMSDALTSTAINLADLDNTAFTQEIIAELEENGYEVKLCTIESNVEQLDKIDYSTAMKNLGANDLIVIPRGFTESIKNGTPAKIDTVSVMKSATSMMSTVSGSKLVSASEDIALIVGNKVVTGNYSLTVNDADFIKNPVEIDDFTVLGSRNAKIGISEFGAMTMLQNLVVIMVIFILVLFASQMIITAIATEKVDKTLETLLSAPVSRVSIVAAKMLAATVVAIINAVVYMIGFSSYMSGMMGGMNTSDISDMAMSEGMDMASSLMSLGLTLAPTDYVLVGLQMFMTIMIALVCSLMLGVLAKDAKSTQTLITPVMIGIMIPFLITIMSDVSSLPTFAKIIVYAIPFTHTFLSINNLVFDNMLLYWGGLIYQIVFFAVCMFFAIRLFTTDKIFTVSVSFGRKKNKTAEN